jgi:hypothetical protein
MTASCPVLRGNTGHILPGSKQLVSQVTSSAHALRKRLITAKFTTVHTISTRQTHLIKMFRVFFFSVYPQVAITRYSNRLHGPPLNLTPNVAAECLAFWKSRLQTSSRRPDIPTEVFCFLHSLSRQIPKQCLKQATTATFYILSNSSIILSFDAI